MLLTLDCNATNRTTFIDQNGVALYKTDMPWKKWLTTTMIYKEGAPGPDEKPTSETTIGEIKWGFIHHKITINGEQMDVDKFLVPAKGKLTEVFKKRTFRGPDGTMYEWTVSKDLFSNELRIKDRDLLIAKLQQPKNIFKEKPTLEIYAEADPILDLLITTFAFVDMERKIQLGALKLPMM